MRKAISILFACASAYVSQAQDSIKIDNFRAPASPAFNILNLGTQSVTRPTTPQGVATTLLSNFDGKNLNPDVAIEFAPYWLAPHPSLTYEDYYDLDGSKSTKENVGQNMLRNLAVSVATTKLSDLKDTLSGTRLGLGLRTQILSGHMSNGARQHLIEYDRTINAYDALSTAVKNMDTDSLRQLSITQKKAKTVKDSLLALPDATHQKKELISVQNNLLDSLYRSVKSYIYSYATQLIDARYGVATEEKDSIKTVAKGLLNSKLSEITEKEMAISDIRNALTDTFYNKKDLALKIQNLDNDNKNRVGFIWEVAAAASVYFPNNSYDYSTFQKGGVWSTLTYRSESQKNEFSLVLRYMASTNDSISSNFDAGISYNRIVDKGFNYGFEYLIRTSDTRYKTRDFNGNDITAISSNFTWRLAITAEYKISNIVVLNAALGKDFDKPFTTSGNLLALLGLNLSYPTKAYLATPKNDN